MMMMEEDDQDDEEPQFLDPRAAVEVAVDDLHVPMEDDDDDDDDDDEKVEATAATGPDESSRQYTSHTGPVYCVAAAWNGGDPFLIVSGGGDDRAFCHTSSGSSSVQLSFAHTDSVSAVALNTDCPNLAPETPRVVAVAGYDGAIVLYSVVANDILNANPVFVAQLQGPTDVEWLSFHPTGTVLLAGSASDGTVWMYHVPSQKCLQVLVGHGASTCTGKFLPNGKRAVTAGTDGTLRVWNPKTGACQHVFRLFQQDKSPRLRRTQIVLLHRRHLLHCHCSAAAPSAANWPPLCGCRRGTGARVRLRRPRA